MASTRFGALHGVEETIAKLGAMGDSLRAELRGLVRAATMGAAVRAKSDAPVGRVSGGTTRDAITTRFFDDGETGAVFVGPMRDPITGRKRADNLPLWLEYGTSRAPRRPFLVPAGRAEVAQFERACVDAVTRIVARAE